MQKKAQIHNSLCILNVHYNKCVTLNHLMSLKRLLSTVEQNIHSAVNKKN